MSKSTINASLNNIITRLNNNDYAELVIHPGIIDDNEIIFWKNSPSLLNFYASKNRIIENVAVRGAYEAHN